MAELVQSIQDLTSLDADTHWFCPRHGSEDGSLSFDEDLTGAITDETAEEKASRQQRVEEAKARTTKVLHACTILAFDGGEAHQYQKQLKDGLKRQLTRCDICVREYHRSRTELRSTLESDYASDEVDQFMRRFDEMNNARISAGLNSATEMLFDLPPEQRNIAAAGEVGMYALFEALNCIPFLEKEEVLRKYFDKPFQLVQSKKKIKLPSYAPGMAAFLFSPHPDRATWAAKNFASIKRPLTGPEFEHSVKPALAHAMGRVNISFLDTHFLPTFWRGTRVILQKLTKELVTNHLRALDSNLYTMSLEHFQVDSQHFDDLLASYSILLELSPDDFWDAMGNCNPQQLIEQVFRSPYLERLMTIKTETEPIHLEQKFAWLRPFITSIKPENLVPPVRVLADQLLKRCQEERYSRYARNTTWLQGLTCLSEALQRLRVHVRGGPVLTHMAELIAKDHIHLIMSELEGIEQKDEMRVDRTEGTCLLIVKEVLAIDVQSLTYDRATIAQTKGLDHELGISSLGCWKMSMRAVRPGHSLLATAILSGIQGLLPLEMFASRQVQAAPRQAQDWNSALNRVMTITTDEFLERLQAFEADNLVELFQEQDGATGVMAMLFSGDDRVHHPALNMIKTMSGEDSRRDSLMHVVKIFTGTTLRGAIAAVRAIAKARVFTPSRTALKICTDIYSCLCDTSDGVLRSSANLNENDLRSLETFWQITWMTLDVIFEQTEPWSNLGHDKSLMQTFCRETMDFADHVFDQYSVIANTLKEGAKTDSQTVGKQLLGFPKKTFTSITKWLRLRDDYLIEKAVSLTTKMLGRLQEVDIQIAQHAAESIESVLTGKTRTKLSMNQRASIQRALEKHMGTPSAESVDLESAPSLKQGSIAQYASSRSVTPSDTSRPVVKKPGAIDVDKWSKAAAKTKESVASAADIRKLNSAVSPNVDLFRKRQDLQGKKAVGPATVKAAQAQRDPQAANDFVAARKKAKEEADRARAAAAAKAKGLGAGSGVTGLGDIGKDHTMKGQNVMVSSDEESSDEDLDDELFGGAATKADKPKSRGAPDVNPYGAVGLKPDQKKGPIRIQRTQRSVKDMRARLAPDLGSLHRVILKWDFFHDGDYPPGSNEYQFRAVANTFMDPTSYQETFQPLLTLEAWQGMVKAREENSNKPYEIKVINRSNVDQFIEISSSVTHVDNRDLSLQEGDIILLSASKKPVEDPRAPHCLARIYRVKRQKAFNEVVYQVTGGSISSTLSPGAQIWGVKIQSITPLEREYGALQGLQYYDLCNQIVKAKPSPRINYSERQIGSLMDVYNVNRAQSEAINAALDNEGFSLIQGPPGSGKTKTIVAIVGGLLSNSLGATNGPTRITMPGQKPNGNLDAASRKLLVCAPSNAAVDELVMRLKEGVKTKSGKHYPLKVVRIGRSDAINVNVVDVTMDELVAKQLGGSNSNDQAVRAKNAELYKDHQKTSGELQELYKQRDSGEVKGEDRSKLEGMIVAMRKRKNDLGIRIDNSKDQEKQAGRENELNRKRAQQAVLDGAHVICATLSGSGHDMFQSLNIEFETVIIDEAAQCVEMSSLIPLKYGCVKCIMVGDPKQLPPTVFSKEAARFQYEQSLFVRMQNNNADDVHLLDTQYRMHPDISIFPSRTFYDGLLKDGDGMAGLRQKPWHKSALLAPYRFFDVKGEHSAAPKGHSLINVAEIDIAMALYQRVKSDFPDYDFTGRVGIITPYKSQLRALKERFTARFGNSIFDMVEFNTTDAFQGRESEIIIFSCVRASPAGGIGFLQDIRRMNVGLTRAKSSLWVLGNSESLMRGQYWRKLVENARERDSYFTGDLMRMLQQSSNAFPASNMNTASMLDVGSHVSQMQSRNQNHTPVEAAVRRPAPGPGGVASKVDRRFGATPAQQSDSSRMEGVIYRFEDRVAGKKRPAEKVDGAAARPRLSSAKDAEDVEMVDAQSGGRTPVDGRTPTGLDGAMSRAETPLSAGEKVDVPVNGVGKTKKPGVPPTVPQPPIRRKKPAADPFLPRKK